MATAVRKTAATAGTVGHRAPVFERLGDATNRPAGRVEREFRRKRRYARHLVQEGYDDFEELFGFLADLRANEAATVERVRSRQSSRSRPPADSGSTL
jgi:hypothetical protein